MPEPDTIRTCRRLARRGFLFGGSTGTVVRGALDWLGENDAGDLTAVAIAPDLGERYLETVYADEWVGEHYEEGVLGDGESETRRSCRRPGSRWAVDSRAGIDKRVHAHALRHNYAFELVRDVAPTG